MGASAGGLEAFERFFDRMHTDSGMGFVMVMHLDARHRSAMTELVQRYTQMKVVEIADGMPVLADRVHVIPPNATLTIERGSLRVVTPRGQSMTIDGFLRSLAEDQGENAIGVILSGSGSDGTAGIKTIKEHGGLTLAQAGKSLRFDSMPHSAVATGLVDFVLPVEDMPAKLIEYAEHLRRLRGGKGVEGFRDEVRRHLARIYTLLRTKTGHDFSRYKDGTFVRRVQRRMQLAQLSSVTAYIELLRKDPREIELLFRDLLIGVTHFFRDQHAFDALASGVIPKVIAGKNADDQIRVWVPGCSTGEEAYSIAILLSERLAQADVAPKVQIFATDIDDQALETARAGRYPEAIARDVSPERRERFFVRDGNAYRVAKDIREMCIFFVHNLIRDAPFSKLDLISCRNMLIYLQQSLQNRVIPLFHFALRRGGYLFLGPSENLPQHGKLFTKIDGRHRIFKARPVNVERTAIDLPLGAGTYRDHPSVERAGAPVAAEETVSRRAMRIMEHYAPAYVVVDEHYEILHFSGRTGKYLQPTPGTASLNLFNILETSLRPDVRAALHEAMTRGRRTVREHAFLPVNGGNQAVNIIVEPIPAAEGASRHAIVAFEDAGAVKARDAAEPGPCADGKDETIAHLEADLHSTRERLQATIEELETSNEEMKASNEEFQSVNEELQSSNKELETSKEELQSVNEELETVNAELSSKLESLERATNDRKNLLESTQIAVIFLDNQLRIKSFTPAITDVLNLIETDDGRPITDIAVRLAYEKLESDVRRVLRTLSPIEQEVALADGSASYMMRILPYRTIDNVIDGVVITFIDITERKRSEDDLARLASIVENSREAIIGMTPEGAIVSWNAGAERIYGYRAEEAVGRPLSLVIPGDRPDELRSILERLKRSRLAGVIDTERTTKDGRRIFVASTISPIRGAGGKIVAASAIERDVAGRKQAEEHQKMLLAELNRRVKNTLATVLSMATRTVRGSNSLDAFRSAFEGRIRALARAHDLLAAGNWTGAELRDVVLAELAPYRERDRFSVSGDKMFLKANAALILGMIFHELAVNSAKHGALKTESGQVEVSWATDGARRLAIRWNERNGPRLDGPPERNGFGLKLIERGLAEELQGKAALNFASNGLSCSLEIPLEEAQAVNPAAAERRRR